MPKIYVLLSKGFVVNDGRLAWFALVALARVGHCWGWLGFFSLLLLWFWMLGPTWTASNGISSYICCFFLLVWGFLVFLAMRVINLTCNQI